MLHVVCPLSSWRKSKATSGCEVNQGQPGLVEVNQGQLSFTETVVEEGGREEEADLIKSSFSTCDIVPIDEPKGAASGHIDQLKGAASGQIDSEELIQQICDDIDETDNILTRTSERAVAKSLAELAEEPIDPIDQSESEGISSCAELDEEGSDVSCASLRSEPEVRTQIELEIPRNIETGSTDNSEPEVTQSHESSGTVKDL